MPGLINAHTHAPMVLFRGAAEDVSTEDWFNKRIWPMEVNLTADDVELGARLACAEMIAAGVTTFVDHYFHCDRIASAVADTGIRANLGWTYFSSEGPEGLDRGLDFALSHRGAAAGRISTSLAPHGVYTLTDDDLRRTGEAAREHDLLVHIHCAENRAQTRASRVQRGITPVAVLNQTGVLEGRTLIAHGKGIVPEDVPYLQQASGRVGVGVSPKGYLKVAEEISPIRLMLAAGVNVGMATDGATSNNTLDVWESMTITALVQKYRERDELWLSARQALGLATSGGAAAAGLADQVGSLEIGKRADIILVDLSGPHTQPIHDLPSTLVFSARSADVSTTIVDGRVLDAGPPLAHGGCRRTVGGASTPVGRADRRQPRIDDPGISRDVTNAAINAAASAVSRSRSCRPFSAVAGCAGRRTPRRPRQPCMPYSTAGKSAGKMGNSATARVRSTASGSAASTIEVSNSSAWCRPKPAPGVSQISAAADSRPG